MTDNFVIYGQIIHLSDEKLPTLRDANTKDRDASFIDNSIALQKEKRNYGIASSVIENVL